MVVEGGKVEEKAAAAVGCRITIRVVDSPVVQLGRYLQEYLNPS